MMSIRLGRPEEAAELTELVMRSKAHWGYPAEFLERVRPELTLHPEQVVPHRTLVAEVEGRAAGLATVVGEPDHGELDLLFVDPWAMGRGVGRDLLLEAAERARAEGFTRLDIESDPRAETFYLHLGAVRVGESVSRSSGRALPLLRLAL
ncbi:GNAT family N-acetyltransferase [Nocardia sp. 2]|uniref:GNAT family N-acetyltransferase n=1 Tax=Nocardia acididurans TaxID=2802282 RepID=A0ABS1MGI0_9NOCA|nr:GNAT family N-acetyltransferase [Nocardia acididurans]MBL1079646.1 GNAT family N-acetyltransferase [Nocardia acididurans]